MLVSITGGTGFIGELLVEAHIQRGDSVRILSRKIRENNNHVTYFHGDLTDTQFSPVSFVRDADILYHCAGQITDEENMHALHIDGIEKLLTAAKNNIGRWVQLSSVGVYKKQRNGIINESSEVDPEGTYEITKAIADKMLVTYSKKHEIDYAILRPTNVFAPSMSNQSLSSMVNTIKKRLFFYIGKSDAVVNYVSVADVVNALILCGSSSPASRQIFNLSQTISVNKMVRALAEGANAPVPRLRVPEWPLRVITSLVEKFPQSPITTSRINALTSHCRFNSDKIENILSFTFEQDLYQNLLSYSQSLSG